MIHYIQPYSTSKNIGGAINLAIESLVHSDDDWIVLLDHDVMFLRPDSKNQLEFILDNQEDFDILSCTTNRLGTETQLVKGMFDRTDILEHIRIADAAHEKLYAKIMPTNYNLAAMLLCFKVSTWKKLGRFTENTLNFDLTFCIRAKTSKMKLGVMLGIYVFHLYRMGQPGEARNNYSHLIADN